MKRFFLSAIIFSVCGLKAQVVINPNNFPISGDTVFQFSAFNNVSALGVGTSGTGQIWNYSGVLPDNADTLIFLNSGSTPYQSFFPASNLSSYSLSNPGAYDYYTNSSSGFFIDGNFISAAPPVSYLVFNPSWKFVKFPFAYGNAFTDTARSQSSPQVFFGSGTADSLYSVANYIVSSVVNAEGTMQLPFGTFPAIRVEMTMNLIDSTYYHHPASGWDSVSMVYAGTMHTYWWYTYDYLSAFPLCQINMDQSNATVAAMQWYVCKPHVTSIAETSENISMRLFPNPARHSVYLNFEKPFLGKLSLITPEGKIVLEEKLNGSMSKDFSIEHLAQGIYYLKLTDVNNEKVCIRKLVKE